MQDELLDLVNDKDEIIGSVLKSVAHKDPKLFHREIAVAIFNKSYEVLLQQRSMEKANDPGKWTISAAGHVGAGEDPAIAVKREVKEELGLEVEPIFFGKENLVKTGKESRFIWIYYAFVDFKPELILDKSEVMDAKWVKFEELNKYLSPNSSSYKFILKALQHERVV